MSFRSGLAAGVSAAALVMAVLTSTAFLKPVGAQGFPPPLPTTYYGTVTGATPGAVVIAYVVNGGVSTMCGLGQALSDGGAVVYAVDVVQDGQTEGCGKAGRTVRFTFKNPGELVPRPSIGSTAWVDIGPGYAGARFNMVLGEPPPLQPRAVMPLLSRAQ